MRAVFLENRRAVWNQMVRTYRHKCVALSRIDGLTMVDVAETGAGDLHDTFSAALVGVFGAPLHPAFPRHVDFEKLLHRASARCLMLEDMQPSTFRGGLAALAEHLKQYQYLVATYDCPLLDRIKTLAPRLRRVHVVPHHIDTRVYSDYGLEKRWDFLLYGRLGTDWYPFRTRLHRIVQENFSSVVAIPHPGYQRYQPGRCGASLARTIAQARIAIATPLVTDYLVAKYFEISACRTAVAGKLPPQGRPIWQDNYIALDEQMSDGQIVRTLEEALADGPRLERICDRMHRCIHSQFNLAVYAQAMARIIDEIEAESV